MEYTSWEEYLEEEKELRASLDAGDSKSFLQYAKSYWLEGTFILKAVLKDDHGEERESQLDLNKHIGAWIDGNKNPYLVTIGNGFVQRVQLHPHNQPRIHRDLEWGPMYCVAFYFFEGHYSIGPIYQRFNLGDCVTVKDGELAFTSGHLAGVPRPPIQEPWRLYFKDLETLNHFLNEKESMECFVNPLVGAGYHLQRLALARKYLYADMELGEMMHERERATTPFLLWLRSEFHAGRLPVKKKLEEEYGPLDDETLAGRDMGTQPYACMYIATCISKGPADP